jgi:hypothetical protein
MAPVESSLNISGPRRRDSPFDAPYLAVSALHDCCLWEIACLSEALSFTAVAGAFEQSTQYGHLDSGFGEGDGELRCANCVLYAIRSAFRGRQRDRQARMASIGDE